MSCGVGRLSFDVRRLTFDVRRFWALRRTISPVRICFKAAPRCALYLITKPKYRICNKDAAAIANADLRSTSVIRLLTFVIRLSTFDFGLLPLKQKIDS